MDTSLRTGLLPNGSRLAAGDPPVGAREVADRPCPPGHKHSTSTKTISARQLQAHVRLQHVASTLLRFWGSESVAPVLLLLNYLESKVLMLYSERTECNI